MNGRGRAGTAGERQDGPHAWSGVATGDLGTLIIGLAMDVHSELGPGLFERMYVEALVSAMRARGLHVEQEVAVPVFFRRMRLSLDYRLDLLVERRVVVEAKAVTKLTTLHESQLRTYLRITGTSLGILLNFDVDHMRQGFRRVYPRK